MRTRITKTSLLSLRSEAAHETGPRLVYDTELRGFGARVTATGVAFFIEYRLGGRRGRNRRMTIGRLGEFTVEEARRKAQRLRADIVDGVDVMQKRDEARRTLTGARFDAAVDRYLAHNARDGRYWAEVGRLLTSKDVAPLKSRPLATLASFEVVAIMDDVALRSPATARALFAALRPFFAWCVPRGLIAVSPLAGLRAPAPVRARDRVLTDTEIRAFWRATGELGFPFCGIFRLLLLTGQRRAEVVGISWREVDTGTAIWTIPGDRTKNGQPHVVDLAPQALAILEALPRGRSDLVFTTTERTPPSGFSRAKARLDQNMRSLLGDELPPWRAHDLRRTAASGMAAGGVPPHIVERILNHLSGAQGGLVGVYQRHDYRHERKQALFAWADRIDKIIEAPTSVHNVVAYQPRPRGA